MSVFVAQAGASPEGGDVVEQVAEAAASGMPLWIWILAGLVALAVVGGLALRRRPALDGSDPAQLPSSGRVGTSDVLGERLKVERPVEVTGEMSLREIKEARAARLGSDFHDSEASRLEKERRKGKGVTVPIEVEPAAEPVPEAALKPEVAKEPVQEAAPPVPQTPAAPAVEPAVPKPAKPEPAARPEPEVEAAAPAAAPKPEPAEAPEEAPKPLSRGLEKTRAGFIARIGRLFSGKQTLDADLEEELEEVLFTADIGVATSQRLLDAVRERFAGREISDTSLVWDVLREETRQILANTSGQLDPTRGPKPFVVLMVGVNGAGKTTTIGKLAAQYRSRGLRVLMVAGDTFRAAAVDQLEEWASRVGCDFHRGVDEADPSSVIFDGLSRGQAEGFDVVLCDTAGRLQTKKPLMDELEKIARVANKAIADAPHETVLVLDANTGQNAIQQAQLFRDAAPLTGLILTKLDGTAKGGVVIGISQEMNLPIYHIGIGEAVSDLRRFDPAEFVDALF